MTPLRVALIGAGGIGELRARAIAQTQGLQLLAIADTASERAHRLAGRFSAEAGRDSIETATRRDVDIVVVSTPPSSHAAIALAAISAGKHVVCEKPLAHMLAAAEDMCAAAEASGVYLKTGFNHRYYPPVALAQRLIASGKIGEVIMAQAYAGHPGGREFGNAWVTDPAVTGGGSLVDNGIHVLDLIRFFMGEMEAVQGFTANLVWPFPGAEDNAFAIFRSSSGKIAQLHSSWTQWRGYQFWVEVVGQLGYVRASYPPMLTEWGQINSPGLRARRQFQVFPWLQIKERLQSWRSTVVESFVTELSAFAQGIRTGHDTPATGRDGLRAMQMADAVYRSSREQREVCL